MSILERPGPLRPATGVAALVRGFAASLRPSDRRPPWQWCEEHIVVDNTSPMPGRWRSDSSPWVKEMMEVFADNRVSDIATQCSAQSSKTQTVMNLVCWAISEDRGPAMWVMAAKDDVKDLVRDRFSPTVTLRMEQLKWDTTEVTKPGGTWNFDLMAETIRYECAACGNAIHDTPAERKAIARTGKFIRQNPTAPRHRVSFHWNALLPPWVQWRSVAEEYMAARGAARNGDIHPMKTFVNETLGQPWKDQLGEIEDFDFLLARRGDYDFSDVWSEERVRVQGVRGLPLLPGHRLETVQGGRRRVLCGEGPSDRQGGAPPLPEDPGRPRVWHPVAGSVRPLPLFRWSNPGMKDLMFEHLTGLVGDWTVPNTIGRDYMKQITAEHRVEERDGRGRIRSAGIRSTGRTTCSTAN